MPTRWLILADDLTGAADCAIAFARRGLSASVGWSDAGIGEDPVRAIDADSRRLPPEAAAARHRALLAAHHGPGIRLIKKIDSTLRGQPAAELAATIAYLKAKGRGATAIVAPAFPATGRTTEAGRISLNGAALEQTPLWARDHSYPDADLTRILGAAGLSTRLLDLAAVRGGREALSDALRSAVEDGIDAAICDAVVPEDLAAIAEASVPLAERVFWTGSGGIAVALAGAGTEAGITPSAPDLPGRPGGMLVVVGSVAEASRAAAAQLVADGAARRFSVSAATLLAGPADAAWRNAATGIIAALDAGENALVEIAADPAADFSRGAALAEQLAALLTPAAPRTRGLFVTGGETACALLTHLGVHGIRLLDELEPGVPLGVTLGAHAIPVMTKAGAFGDAGTIGRSLARLHSLLER
jgi:uncharacterized protein YgbK (DUF1537 family)